MLKIVNNDRRSHHIELENKLAQIKTVTLINRVLSERIKHSNAATDIYQNLEMISTGPYILLNQCDNNNPYI